MRTSTCEPILAADVARLCGLSWRRMRELIAIGSVPPPDLRNGRGHPFYSPNGSAAAVAACRSAGHGRFCDTHFCANAANYMRGRPSGPPKCRKNPPAKQRQNAADYRLPKMYPHPVIVERIEPTETIYVEPAT